MKNYLMKTREVSRNGKTQSEKMYFPEFNAAFGADLRLYEVSEVEGSVTTKIIVPRPESNKNVDLYRFKEGDSANVFAVRKETLRNGVKTGRELIYNGYGPTSQYALACGDVVLIFSRHANLIYAYTILVLPVFHPEKQFNFTVQSSKLWIEKSQVSVKSGVLTIIGRNFRFICDEKTSDYKVEEISEQETAEIRAAAPHDDDASCWVPAEFIGE